MSAIGKRHDKLVMNGNSSGQFCSPNGGIGALRGGRELVAGVANVLDECLDSLPKTEDRVATQKTAPTQSGGSANHKPRFTDTQRTYSHTTHGSVFFPTIGNYERTGSRSSGYSSNAPNCTLPTPRPYASIGHTASAYSPAVFFNASPYNRAAPSSTPYGPVSGPPTPAGYFTGGYNPGVFNARAIGYPAYNPIAVNPGAYNMSGAYNPGQAYNYGTFRSGGVLNLGG